jgi:hypothetical protein
MAKGQTPALTPQQADRYREVVRLRAAGLTFDEIAERVNYKSRSGAKEAYDRALELYGREAVDSLRQLEGERLEQLWRYTFGRILSSPDSTHEFVSLVNSAVRISNSRASLFGLEAPRQLQVTGQDGGPIETDVGQILVERLRALGAGAELGDVIDVDPATGE